MKTDKESWLKRAWRDYLKFTLHFSYFLRFCFGCAGTFYSIVLVPSFFIMYGFFQGLLYTFLYTLVIYYIGFGMLFKRKESRHTE